MQIQFRTKNIGEKIQKVKPFVIGTKANGNEQRKLILHTVSENKSVQEKHLLEIVLTQNEICELIDQLNFLHQIQFKK